MKYLGRLFKFEIVVHSAHSQHVLHTVPVLRKPIKLAVLKLYLRLEDTIEGAGVLAAWNGQVHEGEQGSLTLFVVACSFQVDGPTVLGYLVLQADWEAWVKYW